MVLTHSTLVDTGGGGGDDDDDVKCGATSGLDGRSKNYICTILYLILGKTHCLPIVYWVHPWYNWAIRYNWAIQHPKPRQELGKARPSQQEVLQKGRCICKRQEKYLPCSGKWPPQRLANDNFRGYDGYVTLNQKHCSLSNILYLQHTQMQTCPCVCACMYVRVVDALTSSMLVSDCTKVSKPKANLQICMAPRLFWTIDFDLHIYTFKTATTIIVWTPLANNLPNAQIQSDIIWHHILMLFVVTLW